jgi:Icc-related predicted phosphoesterase
MGFSKRAMELERVWDAIPDGTDIVVTHQPPYNMHDLAYEPSNARAKVAKVCNVCGEMHRRYTHWGNWSLRNRVAQVGAKVHIFGHVHDSHGFTAKDGTLFINAAQDNVVQPIFFDLLV